MSGWNLGLNCHIRTGGPSPMERSEGSESDFSDCMRQACATSSSDSSRADKRCSRSADQLSPKWQATAESIHLEAPGGSTLTPTPGFCWNLPRVRFKAVRAWKVKRVGLAMALRKNAKLIKARQSLLETLSVRRVWHLISIKKKKSQPRMSDLTVLVASSFKLYVAANVYGKT